jgi:hypothetical protein
MFPSVLVGFQGVAPGVFERVGVDHYRLAWCPPQPETTMITGAVLVVASLLISFRGSTTFNSGTVFGWGMALVCAAVFLTRLLSVP